MRSGAAACRTDGEPGTGGAGEVEGQRSRARRGEGHGFSRGVMAGKQIDLDLGKVK